ncbi:FecR family protein [Pararcticibacter amylolyticus]|uniref:FecR family protein n=1 Tax=Pararcticibacter amylolyticus TaxID=2173175 RepID=UPI0011B22697|nr:FecR family protein [Pararcticibacter amylolyticus]
MDKARLNRLIRRYQTNKATSAERYIIDRWYESFLNERKTTGNQPETAGLDVFKEKILREVLNKRQPVPLYRRLGTGIAAAIALLLLSVTMLIRNGTADKSTAPARQCYTAVSTGIGEVKRLVLSDSSVIFLNANSSLYIPPNFRKQNRVVKLQGEAFFDIKKDSRRPFKVYTGSVEVRVLGTSFNVRGYTPTRSITISVSTGKVSVSGRSGIAGILNKGRKMEISTKSGRSVFSGFNTEKDAGWRSGTTVLEQASFGDLAELFYNYYGIKLQTVDPEIKTMKYNFTIRASRQWNKTLLQLCRMTGKKFRKEENRIILY